jgi:hypothetical protein
MSNNALNEPEELWDQLLSRQPKKVQTAFENLSAQEQHAVLDHLQRMATEPDWHPEQRISAAAALEALSRRFD